ncbi:MAG: hypothetical protein K1X92_18760, partial [Bacteroidia bacterium]|nr:hypothetical protein [Bacteroidia bacterium]
SVVNVELQGSCKACLATTLTFGLMDLQGREVLSRDIKSEKETVSLGGLPEGLYIWRVEDLIHGGYETGKVVIQR